MSRDAKTIEQMKEAQRAEDYRAGVEARFRVVTVPVLYACRHGGELSMRLEKDASDAAVDSAREMLLESAEAERAKHCPQCKVRR